MNLTDSDEELYHALVDVLYAMPAPQRQTAHWVMNDDWARRIDEIRLRGMEPVSWAFLPHKAMLGKPVEVTDDGGEPHMVAEPQRDMAPVEPGKEP